MNFKEVPERLRTGKKIQLAKPSLYRLFELHELISTWGHQHKFLFDIWKDTSIENVAAHTARAVKRFDKDEDYVFHILEIRSEKLVGCVGIHEPVKDIGYHEIGYWIGTNYMGRGYATEAVILARNIAIKMLTPTRLEIGTARTNHASNAVARKAGFQLEATLKNFCLDADGNLDDGNFYTYPVEI